MIRVGGEDIARQYFDRSRVDYPGLYMYLYASYNAWHRVEVGAANDREALRVLKQNFNIWHQYYEGESMQEMTILLEAVVELTSEGWPVAVANIEDWRSMVDFWYKIRCELVHGGLDLRLNTHQLAIKLAYDTLSVFMAEALRPKIRL